MPPARRTLQKVAHLAIRYGDRGMRGAFSRGGVEVPPAASVAMLVWHSRPRLWSLGSKLFAPCLPLEGRSAKFLAVFIGVVANLSKHLFIVTIAAQLIVILVAHKPGIVVISQLNGSPQPHERLRFVAEQRIDAANPVGSVSVSHLFGFFLKNLGINLVPLSTRCIEVRRQ